MKVKQATIYGFGKWIDYSMDFSGSSFHVIYGENEAGKSTIQQFILFMLFGLPPKQRAFYRPKTSGKMGGRLLIEDTINGEYTIERLDEVENGAARCYLPSGQEEGEVWLQNQLHYMTKEIYQSIYSFSALDLNDFTMMKDDDLGEILLGIGFAGSRHIHTLEKQLDNQIGRLFKPTGKIPILNQQLHFIDDLYRQLTEDKSKQATYKEKQASKIIIQENIGEMQQQLRQAKEQLAHLEKYLQNMPLIHEYRQLTKQFASLPSEVSFPENGVARLQQVKEKLLPMQSQLSVLRNNQRSNETMINELRESLLEDDLFSEVHERMKSKQDYNKNKQKMNELEEVIHHLSLTIDHEVRALRVGLRSTTLTQLDVPFYLEKTWQELNERASELERSQEQLDEEKNTLVRQKTYITDQLKQVEQALLTDEDVNKLEWKVDTYETYNYIQQAAEEAGQQQIKWEKSKEKKAKQSVIYLGGSMLLTILFSILGFSLDYSIFYQLALVSFLIGGTQYLLSKRSIGETEELFAGKGIMVADSSKVTLAEKQRAEQLLSEDDERKRTVYSLTEQLKTIQISLIKSEEKGYTLQQQEQRIQQEVAMQEERYPFLGKIKLKYWPTFYHTLTQLLDMEHKKQETDQQLVICLEEEGTYKTNLEKTFRKIKEEHIGDSLQLQFEVLEKLVREQQAMQQKIAHIEREMIVNGQQQTELIEQMKPYEAEIEKLFTIAVVDTEEDFYQLAAMYDEQQQLKMEKSSLQEQLQIIFSSSIKQEIDLEMINQSKMEVQAQLTDQEAQQLEHDLEERRQQLADVNADLKNMESSEVYSDRLHRFTMEKEELTKSAHQWAVLTTAKEMLAETKRQYRDKYLTAVVEKTTSYFKIITNNAYEKVIAPLEDKLFQVETSERQRYNVDELSKGTIDQLYIALRFAISEILSEQHALPFMIDDAFVHFDTRRTGNILGIMKEISQRRQVILFTCKQDIIQQSPSDNIIHLYETM